MLVAARSSPPREPAAGATIPKRRKAFTRDEPGRKAVMAPLGRALGLSTMQVWRLVQRGMPTDEAGARAWRAANIETKGGGEIRGTQRLRDAQARIADLNARRMEGELGRVSDFRASVVEAMVAIRSAMEAVAGRTAHQLAGMNDPAVIRQHLLTEIRSGLNAAADRLESWASLVASNDVPETEASAVPVAMGGGKPQVPERQRGARTISQ